MTLKQRLIIVISLIAVIISILSITINSYLTLEHMKEETIKQFNDSLTSKRILVGNEITDYFTTIEKQVVVMAHDISIVEAATQFKQAFNNFPTTNLNTDSLKAYYKNEFKPTYDQQNKTPVNINKLYDPLPNISLALQTAYIGDNVNPLGEKDALTAINDGSDYDAAHQRYHPSIRKFLQEFGYYDIFIVEPENGYIVYSVFKELDYATSLKKGPYQNSDIAKAFNEGLKLNENEFFITDFNNYLPSYNNPASFISSPIYENGELSAVLIFQMPINIINELMTQHGKWVESGFGASGEVYLVGEDNTLRNESRFFVEDKEAYINLLNNVGIDTKEIINKNTSISLQPVLSHGAKVALKGQTGFEIFTDYRDVHVLSSFAPIKVGNLTWAIMSEIDEEEALAGVDELRGYVVFIATAVTIVVAILAIIIAMIISGKLTQPLKVLSNRVADLSEGDADLTIRVADSGIAEIDEISHGFNRFIAQLNDLVGGIQEAVSRIASSSTELSVTTEQTNLTAEDQNNNLHDVQKAIEAFAMAVEEVTERTVMAFEATTKAKVNAEENSERADLASDNIKLLVDEVGSSAETIEELQSNVQEISDVLNIINSIADQTNLLALNAAIEAARAGEHGRGFAVVADEVRTLAKRTQESTVTIQSQISKLNEAADKSVHSMDRASTSARGGIHLVSIVSEELQQLRDIIVDLSSMNAGISESSKGQIKTISVINDNIHQINESADEMMQASKAITGVANELASVAEEVKADFERFKV